MISPATLAELTKLARNPSAGAALAPHLDGPIRDLLRDMLIQEALPRYGAIPKTQRARALAADLARGERGCSSRSDFCTAILAANGGRPLGWRRLVDIADGLTRSSAIVPLQRRPGSVQLC